MLKYVPTEDSVKLVYRKYILILLDWMHLHLFSRITTSLLNKRQTGGKSSLVSDFSLFLRDAFNRRMFVCVCVIYVCIYVYTHWAGSKWVHSYLNILLADFPCIVWVGDILDGAVCQTHTRHSVRPGPDWLGKDSMSRFQIQTILLLIYSAKGKTAGSTKLPVVIFPA